MSPLLQAGLNLTAIGMGVVFALLTALVFIIRGMSVLAQRIGGPVAASAVQTNQSPKSPQESELVSVISAAVTRHRQSN